MNKNDVTLNYAFQEYIPEKKLNERGIKGVSKILTYEEPRWTLKDTASALKIIKEADSALYETIQTYIKEQHLPSENTLQLDFGKSLRYDDEYMGDFSKETLSDKLDNRFIIRYSHDNDEGNLIDGGDEIIINDKELVSLFNGMIEGHVKENIQKYDEYKIKREASQKNEVWSWKDYDDLSGHLVAPDGKSYFSYDWTTKEYKVTPDSTWDSFLDADPTRDTSLSAFKEYAQNYIKNNIVKDKSLNIVFERNYIDTEKLMEEEEKKMAKSETLADKYNRMEKLFEDKLSHLGSGDGETFKELCKWVEEEFPEKDSEGVLLEATSRMIEENLDFGEFNYQAFDDVYGFGDGAEWRLDFSDSAAKELLSGEIVTLSDAQSLIWEKAEKEFAGLKNNPQYKDEIEITDRINSAFRIADATFPDLKKEFDENHLLADEFPQYSAAEKKTEINKAFERLRREPVEGRIKQDEKRRDMIRLPNDNYLLLKDLEALVKGRDAVNFGKDSLSFIRPNAEQMQEGIEHGWWWNSVITGYSAASSSSIKGAVNIEKIDDMNVFEHDSDAAKQYGIDHNCRILEEKKDIWIGDDYNEYYSYPDTPENREALKEFMPDKPISEKFDWSKFSEEDFNNLRDEIKNGTLKEDYKGLVNIGAVSFELSLQDKESNSIDYNVYVMGEENGYGWKGDDKGAVPYASYNGNQLPLNMFSDIDYEAFQTAFERKIIEDIELHNIELTDHIKEEMLRPNIDWTNEKQCKELYHTKLVEAARLNEIVIAPYSREKRDIEAVRDFIAGLESVPALEIEDNKVFAVIDNIGKEQTHEPGDFLKIRKNGTVEHISSLGPVEKEPVEVLHIINSFAEDHASVSENGSQQRNDYEYTNSLYKKVYENYIKEPSVDSYKQCLKDIQEQIEKESGIKVDEKVSDEIYSRYKDHDLTLKRNENGSFTVYDDADGKYTNPITIKEAVKQVMAWDDKELSELHPGTADDETIGKIKGYLEELEHVNEQIAYNLNVTLKDVNEKLKEHNMENKEFKVTHSVTFPCGFTFPDSVGKTEREQNNYRKKIYKNLQEKYGFSDNDAETGYWPEDDRAEASFNIHFAVSVPEEIKADIEKVNAWIEDVEKFVKEECGCSFIDWQGGERHEQTFVNEKQYKMQQKRNNDFAHPNAEDLDYASPKDIKEYCKLNSEIELSDKQLEEIHNFYDNNDQFALYVSPAGNLYVRNEYDGNLISADSELLKAGNYLRTLEGKEKLEYLVKNTSIDEPEWSKGLLNQTSNDSDERLRIVSDVLSDSFATLDRHDGFWQLLLDYGADPTRAIRIAAEDANLGDNLNWLLNNVPESHLNQIFSDNGYADAVFDIAKKSVEHDMDSWHGGEDIGFEGFKRIARLCERVADADRYYGELLEKAFEYPVEPKIVQLLDTPELLAEKMNNSKVHPNEPSISRDQASSILDYCNYENIKFYVAKDGGIYSLDVSEDYNGEGMAESNFGIVANGIEYARKAQDLEYPCYSTKSFSIVKELWQKERQFANPSVENTIRTFTDDIDKMRDFDGLSKEDFLASYDYISEEEYDATAKELKEHGRTGLQTVKALAYKNVMDKNYLAYDNRLEKSGSEADKIQSAIERLTDVSLPAVAGEIGKSEQDVAEIISALLDAKDYVEERFNVVRPTADEIIEKVRDEVSWADILKTELSWKELGLNPEDYDRAESGTETEKDFKEWAMGLELENTLDLHGFDTALEGVSSWNNSTISEQKWMIIDKLSEEIVSGKLKIENSQDAFDKLLKENEVYKDFVQKGIVKDDAFGLREISEKEPVDIIKEIATQKELAEVPELFTREFKNRMKTHFPGPEKDPFIVAKAIINDWKTSKPDYIPALNKWLSDSLKKEGFSTKENLEKGFEKFFKKLSSTEQKRMQHKDSDIGQGR